MLEVKNNSILKIRDLKLSFSQNIVLNNISLDVEKGQTLSIIGRSGCGKTTFLRSLVFLEIFSIGNYILDDIEIDSSEFQKSKVLSKKYSKNLIDNSNILSDSDLKKKVYAIRRKIGFLFQSYNLFPHLTVIENLKLSLNLTLQMNDADAKEKSINILKKFGLETFQNRYPHQLSGGQQQRVAICRALVIDPTIMLYDEPTSALDPELVKDVIEIMNFLKSEGMTQIIVTHSLGVASAVSDKVIYMESGNFVETGFPEEILKSPKDSRTKQYIDKVIII